MLFSFFDTMSEKKQAITQALKSSYSFQSYIELIEHLHTGGKATIFQHNEEFFNYSKLNLTRMTRVYKKLDINQELSAKLEAISEPRVWVLITESWCGDAAQTVPIIAKLAELNPHITLHIVLRDSNEELMEHYLTNGGKSIPILAILDADHNELAKWGPRPGEAQQKVIDYKALPEPRPPYQEMSQQIQMWYNKDKGVSTQAELLHLV
ncbi:MAG: thioredoxin family protein [Flavobacteriales bacterium]